MGGTDIGNATRLMEEKFGYRTFRPGQTEIVSAILEGRDCVGVMPTGAGKSLCYQVPALVFANEDAASPTDGQASSSDADRSGGNESAYDDFDSPFEGYGDLWLKPASALTLVVSPLVSLMSDQVMALKSVGVSAAFLNSRLTARQQEEVLARARAGTYALMYVAPERLDDPRFLEFAGIDVQGERDFANAVFHDDALGGPFPGPGLGPATAAAASPVPIALVAVDEAHCVSQWGQDFRPSYLRIADFIAQLPTRPVVAAFTATATPRVADDIVRLLRLRNPARVTTGFDRPNLHFGVEQLTEKKKLARIAAYALEDPNASGVVYCSTRKDVERVHEALVEAGVRATRYHAGLAHGEREANQRAFVTDDAPVMVATNAFGMGIDKSNVRYVIHHNMPGSLEAYYQEAGRAGRDGEPADCLLLWNDGDIATCRFFIEQETNNEALSFEEQQVVRASQRRRLAAMSNYCMTTDCLRATILRYFGERDALESGADAGQAPSGMVDRNLPGNASGDGSCNLPEKTAPAVDKAEGEGDSTQAQATGSVPSHAGGETAEERLEGPGLLAARGDAERERKQEAHGGGCGNCSNCTGEVDAIDVTKTARSVMRCVHELRGRFGKGIVCDVLCGSKSAKLAQYGLLNKKTYGIVDDSSSTVKEIIELLTAGEYLEISEGRYPLVGLGPRAREAATDEFRLYMKRHRTSRGSAARGAGRSGEGRYSWAAGGSAAFGTAAGTARSNASPDHVFGTAAPAGSYSAEEQDELFERLRTLRKRLADEASVPPYIVFSDAALRSMCESRPVTDDDFLAVPGVGPAKLARYGQAFLEEINR